MFFLPGFVNIRYQIVINKRKQRDDHDALMEKMQEMFNIWINKQENKMELILNTVQTIKKQNVEISTSIEFLSQQYNMMKEKVDRLEQDRKSTQAYILVLEEKVEAMERNGRNSSIEIRNVPAKKPESYEDLKKIVTSLGQSLGVSIQPYDIRNIYRINSKSTENKPIIADFNSVPVKNKILAEAKTFSRQNGGNRPNTSDLQIPGASKPIYLSENLTQKSKRLHFLAREYAKTNGFEFCWVSHGRVFLRKKQGEPAIRIDSEMDIRNIPDQK